MDDRNLSRLIELARGVQMNEEQRDEPRAIAEKDRAAPVLLGGIQRTRVGRVSGGNAIVTAREATRQR